MRSVIIRLELMWYCVLATTALRAQPKTPVPNFISGLDSIRTELKIPGMAVAIMQNDSIFFEGGLGYADLQNHIKATANTSFRVASITKTFTSTLIMQLVEQGKLDLDSPVSKYGLDFGNDKITVKNLLTHTSEGEPGHFFQYNGYRYGRLGPIIEQITGIPFYEVLMEKIVKPLNMSSTAPGISLFHYFNYIQKRKDMQPFFERAFTHLAQPYAPNEKGEIVETEYLDEFGAFGGLVTTVGDLLKYSAAIERHQFVSAQTQQLIFTPNRTKNVSVTPYGFGWFTQNYKGIDFYWHYGQTQGESGLFVKVPSKNLTMVVLTNSDKLSQPFPLGDGDLFTSPVGQLFYKYFISNGSFEMVEYHLPMPMIREILIAARQSSYKDFYNKELVSQAAMSIVHGDTARAIQFYVLYAELNFNEAEKLPVGKEIAAIRNAKINENITKPFTIVKSSRVRIYGVGENCSGDFSSWCDYGWIEDSTGKVIWQMQGQPAKHAGGAMKNQMVDMVITLPPGSYTLHYKSDGGHAYNNWDSAPPNNFFWGIILFSETN